MISETQEDPDTEKKKERIGDNANKHDPRTATGGSWNSAARARDLSHPRELPTPKTRT